MTICIYEKLKESFESNLWFELLYLTPFFVFVTRGKVLFEFINILVFSNLKI